MGETSSTLNRIRKLKNRTQSGFSCFIPRRNFSVQPKVLAFAQCKTDFAWDCALILLELYGSQIRLHATTDDYDNIKKIGDKNMLKYLNKLLFVHKIDLSSESSTEETWNEIVKMEGRVDVLVCHNDQPCIDFVEDTAQNFIPSTFESNFFEPVTLLKTAVLTFKRQKYGRIISINTVAGTIGIPLHSIYCSAKFAFDGFLESIAAECIHHNVKVSIIQTHMDIQQNAVNMILGLPAQICAHVDEDETKFQIKDELIARLDESGWRKRLNPHKVTKIIKDVIDERTPHFRYSVCKQCRDAMTEKLLDPKGSATIKEISKFCLSLDVD